MRLILNRHKLRCIYTMFSFTIIGAITMKTKSILQGMILIMVLANSSLAQINFNSVSVNVGQINTLFPDVELYSNHQHAFYSELEVDAEIAVTYIRGGVYWGYWNDGLDHLSVRDAVYYSFKSHIVGTRFTFLPNKLFNNWLLPFGIFAGAAHHFVSASCVGGFDFIGNTCSSDLYEDYTRNINTLEVGLSSEIHILGPLKIQGKVNQFFPLGDNEFDRRQKNRRAYKVGLVLSL